MILAKDYPKVDPEAVGIHNDAIRNPAFLPILADWYEDHGHHESAALARFGRTYHAWIVAGFSNERYWMVPGFMDMGRFLIDSGVDAREARFFTHLSAAVEAESPEDLITRGTIELLVHGGIPIKVDLYLFRRHPR